MNLTKQKNILNKDEWRALNDLLTDDSIIITKPDKGNGIIIVSRLDYLNKIKQLLSDNTRLKPLTYNPTKAGEESLSSYLRKLGKDEIIDDTVFRKILPDGSSPGVLYGLPKVHKTGCPFHPSYCFFSEHAQLQPGALLYWNTSADIHQSTFPA